jgi:hypothetical protein
VLAVPFAIIFAVIVDVLAIGSRTREGIRHLRNRLSEHSDSLLAKRIESLQKYQKQLADPRWQYLFAFQIVFMILFVFAIGATFWVLRTIGPFRIHPVIVDLLQFFSLNCFAVGGGVATVGFTHVWRDTPEKVQAVVLTVGHEIVALQRTLAARASAGSKNTTAHVPEPPSLPPA